MNVGSWWDEYDRQWVGGDTTALTWDAQSRITGITFPGGGSNAFVYNGLGQRVGKADSSGNYAYTLADDSIDSNVLGDGAASYQYGLGLVSEVRGGASRIYHADSLGTTRAISDASGSAAASLDTDAFGNVVASVGAGTPFGFAGQHGYQSDVDSGLMRLGHRYYDSSTGRFLSRDPIQDGYNWYTYCDNDPVNAVDPEGLQGSVNNQHSFPHHALVTVGTGFEIVRDPKGNPVLVRPSPGRPGPTLAAQPLMVDPTPGRPGDERPALGNQVVVTIPPRTNIDVRGLDFEGGWDGREWDHSNDTGNLIWTPGGVMLTPWENSHLDPDSSGPGIYLPPKPKP